MAGANMMYLMYCHMMWDRLKGIVGSAIDTASVGAGWLASSLPVPGENLFRADKASLFRRKEQYDELDESSILNAGNVSSHVETGSPPVASASFLGLGRQSHSSTPASGGLGSLIGEEHHVESSADVY